MCYLTFSLQAQCSMRDIISSSLPVSSPPTTDANQIVVPEVREEGSHLKPSRALTQSKITSLYTNGQHKVVESTETLTGSWHSVPCLSVLIVFFVVYMSDLSLSAWWNTLLEIPTVGLQNTRFSPWFIFELLPCATWCKLLGVLSQSRTSLE